MMKSKKWVIPVALLLLATQTGCGMTRASRRPPAPVTVVQPTPPEMLAPKKGSIWQSTDRNTLFLDNKARNIGDIITVQISEKSSAEKDATTELKRGNSNAASLGGMLDLTTVLKSDQSLATATASSQNDFKGQGNTTRESTLVATVSCLVTEVLPNGNLRIEGRRDITINHENQFILLSGIVRPEDISPENTVTSAQIADARIDYSGDGDIDQQQRPSWLNRFFSTINVL
ncbi:MAG: flagellar basal body L-ring protein FlgH [Magnetococcales bacterium]|nr:flagellar basal body L-ring protein FlgH [Magnetococcales bacterium]